LPNASVRLPDDLGILSNALRRPPDDAGILPNNPGRLLNDRGICFDDLPDLAKNKQLTPILALFRQFQPWPAI
jgi:hypothetical protein